MPSTVIKFNKPGVLPKEPGTYLVTTSGLSYQQASLVKVSAWMIANPKRAFGNHLTRFSDKLTFTTEEAAGNEC